MAWYRDRHYHYRYHYHYHYLVQGPAVTHPNLLVLAGDVGMGQVHSPEVVTTHQNLVISSLS